MNNPLLDHIENISISLGLRFEEITKLIDSSKLTNAHYFLESEKTIPNFWQLVADRFEIISWLESFRRRQQEILNFKEQKIYYHLFSPGSAASRAIRKHYNLMQHEYCATGLGVGHGDHIISPEYIWVKNTKSLYIVSHPIETLISHYLRSIITQGDGATMMGGLAAKSMEYLIRNEIDVYSHESRLKNINTFFDLYIENGVDFFLLKDHIKNWSNSKNVYACKYEEFKDNEKEINNWLDKPKNYPEFEWKKRNSKREYLSQPILKRLERMYSEAIEIYEDINRTRKL